MEAFGAKIGEIKTTGPLITSLELGIFVFHPSGKLSWRISAKQVLAYQHGWSKQSDCISAISSCRVGLSTLFRSHKGGRKWGVAKTYGAAKEKNMFVKATTARSVVNQVFLKFPRTLSMCVDMYVQKFTAIYMTYMSVTCL